MKKVSAVNYQRIIFVHPKIVGLFNQLVYFYVKKKNQKKTSITQNNSLHTTSHNFYPLSSHSGISKLTLHDNCREKNKESDIQYTLKKNFVKKL